MLVGHFLRSSGVASIICLNSSALRSLPRSNTPAIGDRTKDSAVAGADRPAQPREPRPPAAPGSAST
eukprot:6510355-Prymnesium_polylepis.2